MLQEVCVVRHQIAALEPVIGAQRYARLQAAAVRLKARVGRRTVWNVNSTAAGGGVAEMLHVLAGYGSGLDISIRWLVIGGDQEFFAITKRLHNQIHGQAGDAGLLDSAAAGHYEQVLAANADDLRKQVSPGDVVLLHDPQTAGLTESLSRAGARVIWRSHIGLDWRNDATSAAWDFLRPYLAAAHAYVFTRRQYLQSWMPRPLTWIIPPSIDPFAAKNSSLDPAAIQAIMTVIGVLSSDSPQAGARFARSDGTVGSVTRTGLVTHDGRPGPDDPVVAQVSRWDRLKDPAGVIRGFAEHVAPAGPGYLMIVGPEIGGVADDPQSAAVFAECLAQWRGLPAAVRARVLLAALPLDDVDENGAMVNAIQRHATVIVQKSLAEGFGLTVAEGMWKGRPVVGSAVGGIMDQIAAGTGVLLPDPRDLADFGSQLRWLLDHRAEADRMGRAGHAHIREHYVGDRHLIRLAELIGSVIAA